MRAALHWLAALALLSPLAATARSADALRRGNEAFQAGQFAEAAKIYETEEERGPDLLTRRFNAGVSWAQAGSADEAVQRFEDVSAKAEGDLRGAALYNAGTVSLGKAKAILEAAMKAAGAEQGGQESVQEKVKKLAEAVGAYRSAIQFLRGVEPPTEESLHNIGVAKTALRSALDQIAKLEEEEKRKAEEEALKEPAQLLRALLEKERVHRGIARGLAKEEQKKVRLGARRLRKSEAENRGLAEKLEHRLTAPSPAPPQTAQPGQPAPPAPPGPSEEEKERNARAAEAIGRAIAAQKDAEVAYSKLDLAGAGAAHTKAIVELRSAVEALPMDIARVIEGAIGAQEPLIEAADTLARTQTGGIAPGETKGSGVGKKIVDALKDQVLLPLAKLVAPKNLDDAKALADDEDDVAWGSKIISEAEIRAPEAPQQPQVGPNGQPLPQQPPQLTPEKAKDLSEGLRREGKTALDQATKAKDHLASAQPVEAVSPAKEALEALKRAQDLLPKPPETPEERLKKLIAREKAAGEAAHGLADLDDSARQPAARALEAGQRKDGKEAGSIAEELGKRPDEPAKKAVEKVREGEGQVYSSAEALGRVLGEEAKGSIDRAVAAFEEALAILGGKEQNKDEKKDQDQKKNQEDQKQEKNEKKQGGDSKDKKKEGQKPYAISPRDARYRQQEMDRKRREEEAKIFSGGSSITVEKDW